MLLTAMSNEKNYQLAINYYKNVAKEKKKTTNIILLFIDNCRQQAKK